MCAAAVKTGLASSLFACAFEADTQSQTWNSEWFHMTLDVNRRGKILHCMEEKLEICLTAKKPVKHGTRHDGNERHPGAYQMMHTRQPLP